MDCIPQLKKINDQHSKLPKKRFVYKNIIIYDEIYLIIIIIEEKFKIKTSSILQQNQQVLLFITGVIIYNRCYYLNSDLTVFL